MQTCQIHHYNLSVNACRDGHSTSLGRFFQCSTNLLVKKCFSIPNLIFKFQKTSGGVSTKYSCHMAEILGMWSSLAVQTPQPRGVYFCISIGVLDRPVGTVIHSSFFTEQAAAQYQNQTDLFFPEPHHIMIWELCFCQESIPCMTSSAAFLST